MCVYIYIYIYIYKVLSGSTPPACGASLSGSPPPTRSFARLGAAPPASGCSRTAHTVSFHNFKSQNFKLSVSNPKNKYVVYLSLLSRISNCQGLGRENKHEILKIDRMITAREVTRGSAGDAVAEECTVSSHNFDLQHFESRVSNPRAIAFIHF